jgi:hypothetical protein
MNGPVPVWPAGYDFIRTEMQYYARD